MWDDEAQRVAVLGSKRLAVMMRREQYLLPVEVGQGNIGSEALFGVNQNVFRVRFGMRRGPIARGRRRRPSGCRSGSIG